jgi:putative ABC transport system permease protein
MKLITLPFRNLRRHPLRSTLTAIGISAALASLLALVGFSRGLERNWIVSLEGKGTHILAFQKGSIDILSAALDENLASQLWKIPGVTSVMPGLGDLIELESGEMALLSGWPVDSDFWKTLTITAGQRPAPGRTDGVVLGETLALLLGKQPGDRLELNGRTFQVTAISKQPSALDDRSVMMPLSMMQELTGREGKVSGFHIRVDRPQDPEQMAEVKSRLSAAHPELAFAESGEVANNAHVTRLIRAISWSSSSIALVMAFVTVLNTLLMSVSERTREIGLLSAIGWRAGRVILTIVLEGLLIAAAGAALGVGLGLMGLRWIMVHPQMGGLIQPDVTPKLVMQAVVLALAVGSLAGVYPAWRATRLRPMALLRSE